MNKFLDGVIQWKSYACLMFTGSTIIYGIITLATGEKVLNIWILFQLLLLSMLGTLIQGIAFEPEWIIKKAKYTTRVIIFIIPFFVLLSGFAVGFQWFPVEERGGWLLFIGIFLGAFIIMTISFEVIFRITGKKYDGLLGQYKKKERLQ